MKVDGAVHLCPDCKHLLSQKKYGVKYQCINPECPVISVTYSRGKPHDRITRITRAAVAR